MDVFGRCVASHRFFCILHLRPCFLFLSSELHLSSYYWAPSRVFKSKNTFCVIIPLCLSLLNKKIGQIVKLNGASQVTLDDWHHEVYRYFGSDVWMYLHGNKAEWCLNVWTAYTVWCIYCMVYFTIEKVKRIHLWFLDRKRTRQRVTEIRSERSCTGPERYSIINVTSLLLLQGCRFLSQSVSVCVPVKENDSHRHIDCRHTCHLSSLLLFVFKYFNFPHLLQNPKEKSQEHNVTTSL